MRITKNGSLIFPSFLTALNMAVDEISKTSTWLAAIRPKTLWAAVAPVLIGVAMAIEAGVVHWLAAALALTGALFIQIGTNFFNDYADFKKGADTDDRKGPLRVTQAGLVSPQGMKNATFLVFGLAIIAGSYLMWRGGWPIVVIGVLSIISGFMYTAGKYSLAYLGLGDIFVLIFFGPVAVGGTYFVQALAIENTVLIAGMAPGLLAVAILLVNNIRDVAEDRLAGKKTIVVRFGRTFGLACYFVCMVVTGLIPIILYVITGKHPAVLLASASMLIGLYLFSKVVKTPPSPALNPILGATARLLLIYSIVFSITWNL
ncbi:MAG: 1,4-dihydroxy-2-naphthoate polyprenyltransferase [Rhodothermales bacterium]